MSKKGRSFVKSEKAARGKNGKIAAAAVTGLLFTVVPAVGCASNTTKGEDYNWNYNKPFFAEADDFMSVDGVLDEEKWQGQNKMEHTSDGITFTATTVFTEKGLYLGLQAFDKNIQWYTRNEFGSNSSFGIKIVKTGEPTYNVQGWYEHPNRNNYYNIDAKTSRSYRETQYNAAAVVDGELNSGETKSLTAELFVPWESLHYSEEELGENGYPDDVQIFVSYMKIVAERSGDNRQLVPGFMEGNRYDTFFLFGPEGLKHVYNSATLGNAVNGVSATDRWIIDDAAGTATTNEDRTQMLWFKNEYSSDFIMEADVTVHKPSEGYHPSVGLISYANQENIGLYAYTGRSLTDNAAGNKVISLKTGTMTDGLQWMGGITLSGDVKKDYDSDTVRMKVIKQGGNFYYFYNGEYWDTEFNEKLAGKVYAGFFANDGCTFSNYSFIDYEGKSDELRAELGKSVYFVSVPGVSARGSVTSSRLAVKKGQPVTITFEPGSGYMLTDVKKNGVGIYDEVYNNSVDCSYTFTPDGDVDIEATYTPFPADSRVNVLLPLRCGGESVLNASVIIYGDGNLSRYNVGTNSKGNAVIELPKAGVYDVGGKQISVSGNYRMVVSSEGYHDVEETFALNNETTSVSLDGKQQSVAADKAFTRIIAMEKTRYGSFKVNDLTVNSDKGFKHNQSTGNYYSDSGARTGYFGDTVASEYVVTFDTAFSEQTHTGTDPVAGGVVTSGGRTLVMKGCWWEGNRLCVAIGETTFTSSELSFSGFENSIGDNGNLRFTVAKYGRTLFVYDKDGALRIWFDESGIHTASGVEYHVTTGSKESFEKDLAEFFAAGDDNAVGIARYGSGGTTEWNVDWKAGGAYDYVSSGDFGFDTETADYSATVSGLRVGNGFVKGSTVRIEVKAKNADKAASVLRLNYGDGQHIDVAGEYDVVKGATVFEIIAREAYTATVSEYADLVTVSGKLKADGVTDFSDATLEVESVGELSGVVNADGSFSVKTLAGVYNIRASVGDKVAYVIDAQITESGSVGEIELIDDTFDLSETAVVNGKPMNTALNAPYYETPSFELRSKAASGEIDALGKNKAYLMPGTKTANDYVYSVNMKGVNAFAGMGITDGESILSFQVVSWEAGGQNLVLECDAMNYNSNSVEVRFPASANVNADATYTVTRTADCIVLSSGTGTKTSGEYEFTSRLTNENGNGQMGGIGITNGQYSLQFQLSNGEARGKRLIIELAEGWCGNDFVLNCESIDTDNVWSTDKLDATITIRRYADKIEVYVGRETVSKVVTITGDGYAYANAGWTVNNADRANGHKAKLAGFFGEGVEHAMVYASNYMVDEMTYTSRFEKIEYHELSAPVSFLDGNDAASGTLTLRNERGVTYTFEVNHGVNIVSVPYGSYSYVFNAEHYEQKSGAITFDAEHTSLSEIKTGRYIDETTLSAAEDEEKIIFTWAENAADIDEYKLVRKGETDVVVASTENGLTATDGTFTVTVDKTASDYVKGATYELVVTTKEGKLAPPADEFTAVEFGYGVINDLSSAEMAERFTVTGTGVTFGFDRGLKLTGGENATARIKSLRTRDLSGVSFVNVLLTGSGNATVAGKTVELNADGVYVNLTPEQYNGGEFDVTFSGSMTIKSIETDAMNGALATSWNETPGCGAVTRNEDGSYTITESNAGSRYSFTSLAMDKSVRFTVSANVKVKTVADKGAQHGFTISSPLDGKARGAMVYDTKYDEVWILSYVPGWTFKQIYRGKEGWLMSDADYNAVDKTNFKLTMVRDNAMLYLLLNDKPLACVNTEVYPMFITADGSTEGVSIKDIPLVTGLASRNVQGSASDPLDTATYSDISLKLTAEHAALNRVTGTISGANANTELYIGKAGGTAIAACDGDGKYSALVPTGAKLVAYDGKKAAFMGEASEAGVKDGAMIDATWMVTGDYDLQKASAEGNGVYDAPAVNGLTPWLPSLATDKPFEFKSAITMRDATDPLGMAGISVVNPATGTRISMQSISWEGAGAKVLLDVQRSNEGNNPYVVACKSANVFMAATKNESGDITAPGAMNVGFKVSRTADRIVISAGPDGSEIKIATITASGIRLASEWSLGDGDRKPANDAKCAEFFADGVELTVGYESYDRFGRSVVYTSSFNEVAAVDVTGTAGTGTGTLDLIAASGAIYELTVTDGAVSGKAPEGAYKARYKGDDGYGSSDALTIAADAPITMAVTAGKSTAIRGGSYLINGNAVEANALGAAEAAASETGSVTLTNNTVNFYHMPDTLTSGDYEYVFNLKNAGNMSGLAIYDGTSRFTVQIAAWEDGGKRVVVDCAGWMGNDVVLNVNGSTNTAADATFTVRRESNTIKVYMGSGESKILVFTVETDGTITLADGTTAANAEAFATRAANMKPLLANFVKSGSQNMVGLGRNDNRSQSVTYTTSFKPL